MTERGEDRVRAVTIGKHGLQIARGNARGLLLPGVAIEHGFDARTFLEEVLAKAGLPTDAWKDDNVTLMVFEGNAIEGPMQLDAPTAPPTARPAAVAGGFYPADPREVNRTVEQLFAAAEAAFPPAAKPAPWAGAMVPHAGWVYSGRLAAAVLQRIEIPDCVLILCPKHRPGGAPWAVAPHGRWLFPGGELPSDPELATRLAEGIPGLELDAESHRQEHAIEVQLPLLAYRKPGVRVVGIIVGDSPLPELLRFGVAMSVVLRDMERRPLLLVSSDMNHFADDARMRRLDRLALDAVATLDPEHVYDVVRGNRISMCGAAPCIAAMEALRWLNSLHRCEEVGYATQRRGRRRHGSGRRLCGVVVRMREARIFMAGRPISRLFLFVLFGLLAIRVGTAAEQAAPLGKIPPDLLRYTGGSQPGADGMVGYNRGGFQSPEFQCPAMRYLIRAVARGDARGVDAAWLAIDATFAFQTERGNFGREGTPRGGPSAVAFWLAELDQAVLTLQESKLEPRYRDHIQTLRPKIKKAADWLALPRYQKRLERDDAEARTACCSTPWPTVCRAFWTAMPNCAASDADLSIGP